MTARAGAVYGRSAMLKVLYWLAVAIVAMALVVALILFFESRDGSSLDGAVIPAAPAAPRA